MVTKKIKYPSSAIRKCDREIKKLLQDIISTKSGGTTKKGNKARARRLKSNTGDLLNKIKPIIIVKNNEIHIDIQVMNYYQYLDVGTEKIKYPWFLTDELIESAPFLDSIARLEAAGIAAFIKDNIGSSRS